jgi:5'-nucleotidase
MLAMVLSWSTLAESAPQTQAAPESGVASIQLLGVNDFHGNLEPITNPSYRTPTGVDPITCGGTAAGGAANLDAYLDRYAALDPDGTIRVHAGDMVGGSPSSRATSTTSRRSRPRTSWGST